MTTVPDILSMHNINFVGEDHKHGRPGWVQVDCPYCGIGTNKMHLGISLSSGACSCWRCGKQNTARVLALLAKTSQQHMRKRLDNVVNEAPIIKKTGSLVVPHGVRDLLPAHYTYLKNRGYHGPTVARLWSLQGIGQASKLSWRLYIPIFHHNQVISWTTRSIKPNDPLRWVSASADQESIRHKAVLYGADYATHSIIIHEGPTDVWATGPGAVATCGTGFTETQLKAMAKYPVRTVCFDNGDAAQSRAHELAAMLSVFPGQTFNVSLETGDDPGEADPQELKELRERFLK